MDLSDLPQPARDRIAAAELEAEEMINFSQSNSDNLVCEALEIGLDPSGIGFSPGSLLVELAGKEFDRGRGRAAAHLLSAVAIVYWKLMKPDVERFKAKLEGIGGRIIQRFSLDPAFLGVFVRHFEVLALASR